MRKLFTLSLLIASIIFSAGAVATMNSGKQGRPIPPGIREADKASNASLDPPLEMKRKSPELAQLRQQAAQLTKLSQAVPQQVEQVTQGKMPKELSGNLKQIEKLAKRLRSELIP